MKHLKNLMIFDDMRPITALIAATMCLALLAPARSLGSKPLRLFAAPGNAANSASTVTAMVPRASDTPPPARRTLWVTTSSYNSEPGQTDDTPFITASGARVRDGVVAANFLPFGTQVRFPDQFGEKIFIVEDRMHARHTQRVDIWHESKQFSLNFGVRRLKMEVL